MQFLLSPGFAKSGTTSMFEALLKDCRLGNFPTKKEVDYLRRQNATLSGYLEWYPDYDADRTFVDITPQYAAFMPEFLRSTGTVLSGHDLGVLFCVREAISRGFSHYLYDLSTNFFVAGFGTGSLLTRSMLARYFPPMLPAVRAVLESMDGAKLFGYSLESNLISGELQDFLGMPRAWRPDRAIRANRTGYLPELYYDRFHWTEVVVDGEVYALPPRAFLFSSGPYSDVWFDFPEDVGDHLLAHSASWTRRIDIGALKLYFDKVTVDYERTCDALGLPAFVGPDTLDAAPAPPLPSNILAKLKHVGSITDDPDPSHVSVFKRVDEIERAFVGTSTEQRLAALRGYLAEHGPSPRYLNAYAALLIDGLRMQELIDLLTAQPSWIAFLDPERLTGVLAYRRPNDPIRAARIASMLEARKQAPILPGIPPL